MLREVIQVDASQCNLCGRCLTVCPHDALEVVVGRARLVNEVLCAGDGICLETCGALWLEVREAAPFDEAAVERRREKRDRLRALAEG
jgi:AhpD family alkylhydroperoxidase